MLVGMKDKKSKLGVQEKLSIIHDGKSRLRFQAIMQNVDARKNLLILESEEECRVAQEEATNWYKQLYPGEGHTCPRAVESSESYQFIDINEVLAKALELKIDPEKDPYLLWVPRMALCVPLPPFWRKKQIEGEAYYYNVQYDVLTTKHPADDFMGLYVDRIRELLTQDKSILSSSAK